MSFTAIGISCGNLKVKDRTIMHIEASPGIVAAGAISTGTIEYGGEVKQTGVIRDENHGSFFRSTNRSSRDNSSAGPGFSACILDQVREAGGGVILNSAGTIINKKSMEQTIVPGNGVIVANSSQVIKNKGKMRQTVLGAPGSSSFTREY